MSITLEEITPSTSGAGSLGKDSRRWGAGHFTDLKKSGADVATLSSPAFTGSPTAPTPTAGNNSTRLATTAYVDSAASDVAANTAARHTQNTDSRLDQGGSNEVTAAAIKAHIDGAGALSAKDTVATSDIDSEAIDDTRLKKNGTAKSTNRYYGTDSDGDLGFYDLPDVSGGYSDEQARDAIGSALSNTDSITFNPDDGAETIEAELKRKTSGLTTSQGSLGVGSSGVYVDLGQSSGKAAAGDDARFPTSDEKAALTAASSPSAGNPLMTQSALASTKLDDLATPDDNTDLDATTGRHGLMSKSDKVKLDGVTAVSNASDAEVTAGTLSAQRNYTPAQLKLAAETHGGALPVEDTQALVKDPADSTKRVRIDAGRVVAGQTRVLQALNGDAQVGLVPFQMVISDSPIAVGAVHWMWMPANFTITKVFGETVSPGTGDIAFQLHKNGTAVGNVVTIGTAVSEGGGETGEDNAPGITLAEGDHLEVDVTNNGISGSSGASLGPVTITILGYFPAV